MKELIFYPYVTLWGHFFEVAQIGICIFPYVISLYHVWQWVLPNRTSTCETNVTKYTLKINRLKTTQWAFMI